MDPLIASSDPPGLAAFAEAHPDVVLFDVSNPEAVQQYLVANHLLTAAEGPIRVTRAGAGNMNVTLRVASSGRSVILKQGRPWVARYPQIAAPWNRTAVEGRFYKTAGSVADVAAGLPRLLHVDEHYQVLVLEDLGEARDYTPVYATGEIDPVDVMALLDWLEALSQVRAAVSDTPVLVNRAMRDLNHHHIFAWPLRQGNGLDLDAMTDGLGRLAFDLQEHAAFGAAVRALGLRYLDDGPHLVHGDYFPGSWIAGGVQAGAHDDPRVRIIDPEFCFLGAREFDYGVTIGHLALARCHRTHAEIVLDSTAAAGLDRRLVLGFAGVEIMRRLIGVAQLPVAYGLDVKTRLLALSEQLVLGGERSLDLWQE